MPSIEFIPIANGMTPQDVIDRLEQGFVHIGDVAIRQEAKIVDPTKPMMQNGLIPCHVWVQGEPMMPTSRLVALLYSLAVDWGGDLNTLDTISQQLLGLPISDLVKQMETSTEEEE